MATVIVGAIVLLTFLGLAMAWHAFTGNAISI